jgi:uracil-DNA glycosylase
MNDWSSLESSILTCRLCPRLVAWREEVARVKRRAYRDEDYWGKPVPGFGDPAARVLIVGLAPGAHGANRTGRMFTGDSSGDFLYAALHRAGFASQPTSRDREDELTLTDAYISAACRCAPPDNKPAPDELAACRHFLAAEITLLRDLQVVVALGRIAFDAILRSYPPITGAATLVFAHNAASLLGPGLPMLVTSYHPSRQNTQTGRLTTGMFDDVWSNVRRFLKWKDTPQPDIT